MDTASTWCEFPAKSPRITQPPRNAGVCVCGDCTPKSSAVNPTNGIVKTLDALRLAVHDRHMNITWQQLIQDLRDSGMPMCVIAKRCDLSPQAVTDIGSGRTAEPKGFAAVKMYALHARRMRSKKKAA